jgi:archaellum component FlaC
MFTSDMAPAWFQPAMEQLLQPIHDRFDAMDDRFDAMDGRLDAMEGRLGRLERRTSDIHRLAAMVSDTFHMSLRVLPK